ncbi:MAG: inorganic polyphosphate kinase [Peptococcaceae bacterium BRH_c4a]|nr:MAG: inorganic polyphosphate kinase [Peptococcaceae bacterium BRH_c4a]
MANLEKKNVEKIVGEIRQWFIERDINIIVQDGLSGLGTDVTRLPLPDMVKEIECLLVFGGDGTILSSARLVADCGAPVLGINLGRLGFLSEIDVPDIHYALESILKKEYHIEERMMIEATVLRDGIEIERSMGLNDAVITKGAFARLIFLKTSVNGEHVSTYPTDGLIVSTPTGSTAYSLSAGGPVVTPELDLMIITPICPHALWARPIVISSDCQVEVELLSEKGEVMLTMDGQHGLSLFKNDIVRITKAPFKVRFIRLQTRNFFRVLKQKLREGDRH